MADEYDVIVTGGGPWGENVAGRTAPGGLTTVVVESELVEGECSYWACMPSKALLHPAEALDSVRRVPGAREAVTGGLDVAQVLKRRNAVSSNWDDSGQVQWLEGINAPLIRGHARLTGERAVTVTTQDGGTVELTARRAVVIATGSAASMPPIEGLAEAAAWDSRKITTASEVPSSLIILGGGAVGVEMAQAWCSLGSQVTLVELQDRLLPNDEPFAGELVAEGLTICGVRVLTGARVNRVRRNGGTVTVTLADGSEVTGDEIVMAVGRRPVTDDLGVETIGLEPGKYIKVDDQLRAVDVAGGWLYAVGDVNARNLLTHMGKYQGRQAGDHILGGDVSAWADNVATPRVVFTDPQVAAVGLTEQAARDKGLNVRVVTYPFGASGGAVIQGEGISGNCQIVVDEDRHVIVGATFVGPGAGELIHAATIAIVSEVTMEKLWHAVPPFPTITEFWLRLLEAYFQRSIVLALPKRPR